MRFGLGAPTLSEMRNGVLGEGIIPHERFMLDRQVGTNAGLVTVTVGGVTIAFIDHTVLSIGDKLQVFCYVRTTKGGTSGDTLIRLQERSGGAAIEFFNSDLFIENREPSHPANLQWNLTFTGLAEVTVAGALQLELFGISAGSDSTVAIGDAMLESYRIRTG